MSKKAPNLSQFLADVQGAIQRSGARALLELEKYAAEAVELESFLSSARTQREQAAVDLGAAREQLDGLNRELAEVAATLDIRRDQSRREVLVLAEQEAKAKRDRDTALAELAREMLDARQAANELHAAEVERRRVVIADLETRTADLQAGFDALAARLVV